MITALLDILISLATSCIMNCLTCARDQYRKLSRGRTRLRWPTSNGVGVGVGGVDRHRNYYRRSSSSEAGTQTSNRTNVLPGIHRIILIRHGESLGNIDERAYATTADWRIPLTELGREQARNAGRLIAMHLGRDAYDDVDLNDIVHGEVNDDDGRRENDSKTAAATRGKIFFYVSPYLRTRQTLREILREIDPECIVGMREEPRIAEQQFGNYQTLSIIENKATRSDYGRFFYRFPDGGESGFDVYNRVSGFIGTMQRDSYHVLERWSKNCPKSLDEGMTICIVTHGLALRLFLMRWFQYTVHEFERSYNPKNGRVVVLRPTTRGGGFELSEVDRIAMGFPLHREQERFRLMEDYSLLDKSGW